MQGRFKRDGSASADPEPRGETDRGSSPQRAQSTGRTPGDQGSEPGKQTGPTTGGDAADRPKPKAPPGPGPRVALRNWRISTRLVSLLALPVVAATTLGALRINTSLDNIDQLDQMKLLTEMTQQATELAGALQDERDRSAGPLSQGHPKDDNVVATREKTERAIAAFRDASEQIPPGDTSMAGVQSTLVDIERQLGKIRNVREAAYTDPQYISLTVQNYNELITSLLALSQDMAQATSNRDMINNTRALATFSSAKEYASIQRAVIAAALAEPKDSELSANDRRYAKTALDKEDEALHRFKQIRSGSTDLLEPLDGGVSDITAASQYAERVVRDPRGLQTETRSYMDWYDQDSVKLDEMSKIEQSLLSEMEQKASELRSDAKQDAFINGALILLVLGVSLVGAFVVARSMVRSLRRLQDTAQDVAQKRLPELVKQLSESDPQDVDTSVESVGVHSRDEIGKVAAAFDDVHREAVRLAAEQALLRGNVNAMFTNLSRRSQGLIQRQLSLISELESREADPDQLSSLFKLDHLATRMRRNGENLLVLAGEEPGRRWTRPVPLVDVLRAAASEVEQYERIELSSVPTTEVAGRVVNDLVHLLAELLENATSFSSPQTKVKVTGHALPDGRVLIEIHDTGIGLSPEDLAAINERLASPPTVDVSVSRRMGLFVVGRLSLRHGIRIQLRPSDSGGTTALVMLPVDVAQGGRKPGASGPGKAGPSSGNGNSSENGSAGLLGSNPSRRQVPGSGPRTALAGGGLPNRPVGAGAGAGAAGSAPSGPNFFESGGRPPTQRNAPGRPAEGRPPLPSRGGDGPAIAPPAGTPARAEASADSGGRPQLPTRGAAPELPGPGPQQSGEDRQQPGTSWGARRSGADDWPSAPRDAQDTPRGHEEDEPASLFGAHPPRSGGSRGPGDTGEYARPQLGQGGPGDTGEYARPQLGQGGPGDTGQFSIPQLGQGGPSDTGQFSIPQLGQGGPADTGQFSRPQLGQGGPGDTGEYPQPQYGQGGPGDTGEYARPQLGQGGPGDTGEYPQPQYGHGDTGEYARPDLGGQRTDTGSYRTQGGPGVGPGNGSGTGEYPLPQGPQGGGLGGPESLPHAGPGDGRTPIFDTIESNWFRSPEEAAAAGGQPQEGDPSQGGRPAAGPGAGAVPPQPPRRETGGLPRREPGGRQAPGRAAADTAEPESTTGTNGTHDTGRNGAAPTWRTSPNDERWRRAEQIREPAAGGITSSGLPRRVPRANLVEGAAQQQSHPTGPQVSRAPEQVRGRLTNLRRGIQQGRQAGTGPGGNHHLGNGPTYQQER